MGTDIATGIRVYHKGNTIIMLLVFIKKSQKMPAKETDLAKSRLAEVFNEIKELQSESMVITTEILRALSSYRQHLNRFVFLELREREVIPVDYDIRL